MNNQCLDRDLLALEPEIFAGGIFDSQKLSSGVDGELAGATFTSESADFAAGGVTAGMVLCTYASSPDDGRCYEIVSVDSATELTVSVLRADSGLDPVAPPAGEELKYHVLSFAPQLADVRKTLLDKLRQIGQTVGVDPGQFADSPQFRQAVAWGALAAIFTARASNATDADANWTKAEFYRARHAAAASAVRLARDLDGEGSAEQTRSLGNVNLRRV